MKKYLHYLKNLKICLFIISILCCCIQQSFSQNIRLKIERLGLRIYEVCVTGWTDHGWHFKNYVDEFSGGYSVKNPMGSPISLYELWYQNNNFNTSTDIDVKMGAYEDDGVLCTGDDAFCGGWNIIHTISDIPNTVAPCGEEFKKSIFCTSDGDGKMCV